MEGKSCDAMLLTLMFGLYYQCLFAMNFVQEGEASDFNDLGKLLLGGFVLAVGVAIAFTFVKLRLREKKPPAAEFISINSFESSRL